MKFKKIEKYFREMRTQQVLSDAFVDTIPMSIQPGITDNEFVNIHGLMFDTTAQLLLGEPLYEEFCHYVYDFEEGRAYEYRINDDEVLVVNTHEEYFQMLKRFVKIIKGEE